MFGLGLGFKRYRIRVRAAESEYGNLFGESRTRKYQLIAFIFLSAVENGYQN